MLDNVFAPQQPESRFDRVLGIYAIAHARTARLEHNDQSRLRLRSTTMCAAAAGVEAHVDLLERAGRRSCTTATARSRRYISRTDGEYWRILDFQFLEGRPVHRARTTGMRTRRRDHRRHARESCSPDVPALGKTFDARRPALIASSASCRPCRSRGASAFSEIWVPIRTLRSASTATSDDRRLQRASSWRAARPTSRVARGVPAAPHALSNSTIRRIQPRSWPGWTRCSKPPRAASSGNQTDTNRRADAAPSS